MSEPQTVHEPSAARNALMLAVLGRFCTDVVTEFGPTSALADLISSDLITWFAGQMDETGGKTANVIRYLDESFKEANDLRDLNRRLREQFSQVVAERTNLENVVIEIGEKSDRKIETLEQSVKTLLDAATDLYRGVTVAHTRAARLREVVAESWFAGAMIEPEELRVVAARGVEDLLDLIQRYVRTLFDQDWIDAEASSEEETAPEAPKGRVVVGEAHINVRMPRAHGEALMASPPRTVSKGDGDGDDG